MGHTSRRNSFWIALVAALGVAAIPAHANGLPEKTSANSIELDAANTATVYKFNVCRRVKNNNSVPILIPLAAAAEWTGGSGFLSNLSDMNGVSVTRCAPSGYDLAFCYYLQTSGGYGQYCGSTNIGSLNPRLIYTAGVFDSDTATLKEIMDIASDNRCAGESNAPNIWTNHQGSYDSVKDKIDWSSGRDWCFLWSYSLITDHQMEGGDSGSGSVGTYAYMRVWNPNVN